MRLPNQSIAAYANVDGLVEAVYQNVFGDAVVCFRRVVRQYL
jgi:hypothetical protein